MCVEKTIVCERAKDVEKTKGTERANMHEKTRANERAMNKKRPAPTGTRTFSPDDWERFFELAGRYEHAAGMGPDEADRRARDEVINEKLRRKDALHGKN
jgi:hypothetical protein